MFKLNFCSSKSYVIQHAGSTFPDPHVFPLNQLHCATYMRNRKGKLPFFSQQAEP